MSPIGVGAVVFGCTLAGALLGIFFSTRLPAGHFDTDSRDVVKLVMGLIATMAALVLGLLISSAHSAYEAQEAELQQLGTQLYQIDRILFHLGPDANEARASLRRIVAADIARTWSNDHPGAASFAPAQERNEAENLFERIASLSPTTNFGRFGQSRALQLLASVGETRRLLTEQARTPLSWVFLAVLVSWLTLLFFGFGLFARFNATVVVALIAGALSVAAALFLILDMDQPYSGWMQISSAPLRDALKQMDE
jgi:Protein of unknown function (DUF4239)